MKYIYLLILCFTLTSLHGFAQYSKKPLSELYAKLDSALQNEQRYLQQKEGRIAQLKKSLAEVNTLSEKYTLNKMLYNEYFVFNADEAMKYTDANLAIAEELHNDDYQKEWMLNKVFLLAATGLLKESFELMRQIDPHHLSPELKISYYDQMLFLYSHLVQHAGEDINLAKNYQQTQSSYQDSIILQVHPDNPYYEWYNGYYYTKTPHYDEVKANIIKRLDASQLTQRIDAMLGYALANMYLNENDKANYERYLILSSIADIRFCNREIASLELLAYLLYERGEIDRAYTYINYCLRMANLYPNRVRVLGVSKLMDTINQKYQERSKLQSHQLEMNLYLFIMLSIILVIAVVFIMIQMRKLSQKSRLLDHTNDLLHQKIRVLNDTQHELTKVNEELRNVNLELQSSNSLLTESNFVKEEYIGYVFSVCSNYIGKLEEFRNNIYGKLKAGKQDEVLKYISNLSVVQMELKEFYHSFDTIFLHIYPTFVSDFNRLLREDEQIVLKEGELLNTELRIYALVRLGINDSVKIAEFLHCSPQTVYNYRLKIRNKAIVPKDDFIAAVRSLGKAEPINDSY